MPALRYRRINDGGVLFCCRTWQTHILTPSAAIIFETLRETSDGAPVPLATARAVLKSDLELDPDAPEILRLLRMLGHVGAIDG